MPRPKGSKNKTVRSAHTTKTQTKRGTTIRHYDTISDMANDVRGVLKSVISQDGKYDTKEASVVGKLYGCELSRMKLQVEIHKANNSSNKADEVLSLT